jgi:hypothetical protein
MLLWIFLGIVGTYMCTNAFMRIEESYELDVTPITVLLFMLGIVCGPIAFLFGVIVQFVVLAVYGSFDFMTKPFYKIKRKYKTDD